MSHLSSGSGASPRQYLFVDTVRFWSMLGIVALHATVLIYPTAAESFVAQAAACLFKYGTIAFFLISGFLLGDRMETLDPVPYLSRRLKILLISWALWFSLYLLYLVAGDLGHHRIHARSASPWAHMVAAMAQAARAHNMAVYLISLGPINTGGRNLDASATAVNQALQAVERRRAWATWTSPPRCRATRSTSSMGYIPTLPGTKSWKDCWHKPYPGKLAVSLRGSRSKGEHSAALLYRRMCDLCMHSVAYF